MRKLLIFAGGFILLVAGLSLVLKHWVALATIIKALGGMVLALIGLVIMFSAGLRR